MKMVYLLLALFAVNGLYAEGTPQPPDQGFGQTLVMIAIAVIFFYFILWRPEQKRRKEMDTLRSSIKKGDRVTAMGIVGTIANVKEHTVIVRMVDGNKIEFLKAAISEVVPGTEEDEKKAERDEKSSKRIDISEAD